MFVISSSSQGLVVPVIRGVEGMNFTDIEKAINELGEKVGAIIESKMNLNTFYMMTKDISDFYSAVCSIRPHWVSVKKLFTDSAVLNGTTNQSLIWPDYLLIFWVKQMVKVGKKVVYPLVA